MLADYIQCTVYRKVQATHSAATPVCTCPTATSNVLKTQYASQIQVKDGIGPTDPQLGSMWFMYPFIHHFQSTIKTRDPHKDLIKGH